MSKSKSPTPIGPRATSKLLSLYYGNPSKDMKLVAVISDQPSPLPALIKSVLATSDEKSTLISAKSISTLHRALSKAWKTGANYIILDVPTPLVANHTLCSLPLTAIVTDTISSPAAIINLLPPSDFLVLNRDDPSYPALKDTKPRIASKSFGHHRESDTRIDTWKPYKTAIEARLTMNNRIIDVAGFITGDAAPSLLAAAATIGDLFKLDKDTIVDGLASYEP